MSSLSIYGSELVYSCSQDLQLMLRSVDFPQFEQFSFALRTFRQSLGEAADDDYWKEFLWPLRVYGFRMLAAPLPSGHPSALAADTASALQKHLMGCERIYPGLAEPARGLLELMSSLAKANSSPLLDAVWELAVAAEEEGKTVAVLVKDQRLAAATETVFADEPDLRGLKVAVPAQMRGGQCFGQIIAAGSNRWFPMHVFSAPRAQEIHLVHYSWISNESRLEPMFRGSSGGAAHWTADGTGSKSGSAGRLHAEELVPVFDWDKALARARRNSPAGPAFEEVSARLSLLEDGWAVFLEADDTATVQVIDLEEDQALQLKRVPVSRLEPGTFAILRTEGGGDYIVPLADRILGEAAGYLRGLQRKWKQLLREAIRERGLAAAAAQLRRYGSRIATEQNIRNWMSPRSIKPHYYEDFAAVMRLIGLRNWAKEYWEAMDTILRAHGKAGQRIRKLLLAEVLKTDPQDLEKHGRKDFNLAEAAGSVLSAFRVEGTSAQSVMVSPGRIGRPFKLEGGLWQG